MVLGLPRSRKKATAVATAVATKLQMLLGDFCTIRLEGDFAEAQFIIDYKKNVEHMMTQSLLLRAEGY